MINYIANRTAEYIEQMPKAQRKKYGQFFTSQATAVFMAELFEIPAEIRHLDILDPGAGSGILSIALIERLQTYPNIKRIDLTCYENDMNIIPLLKSNLDWGCQRTTLDISCHNDTLEWG